MPLSLACPCDHRPQQSLTLILLHKHRFTNGVSRYFSKVSGSGVDLILVRKQETHGESALWFPVSCSCHSCGLGLRGSTLLLLLASVIFERLDLNNFLCHSDPSKGFYGL